MASFSLYVSVSAFCCSVKVGYSWLQESKDELRNLQHLKLPKHVWIYMYEEVLVVFCLCEREGKHSESSYMNVMLQIS